MKFDASTRLYRETLKYIPMGTSTFSKNPNLFVIGSAPLFIRKAEGCMIVDMDDNEFIDYSMALSTVILGYAHPEVCDAAKSGIDEGFIYTLACPEESILAKKLVELIPCAEMVRFIKNGSDACEGAIRLARNHTNKLKILTLGGYHGFHDWFLASTPRNKGIPSVMAEWVLPHDYNDIDSLEHTIRTQADQIAALIMEPVINYKPMEGFIQKIRALTEQHNIVLIFDEMKTGFRMDIKGAQGFFGVVPDIAIFGKGLANGFPLSALVGKAPFMRQFEDENCFLSASYATEKASLRAALKTLEVMQRQAVLSHVWEMGGLLKAGIKALIAEHRLKNIMNIVGYEPMTHFIISDCEGFSANEIKSFIQQESVKRGVLFVGYNHTSFAHQKGDIDQTLAVYDEVFSHLKKALSKKNLRDQITGTPISVFGVRKPI